MPTRHAFIAWLVLMSSIVFAPSVRAHDTVVIQPSCGAHCTVTASPPPPDQPRKSVFRYTLKGLLTGSATGLGIGYLFARGDHQDSGRTLGFATGVGALAGASAGMAVGLLDGRHGGGYTLMRYAMGSTFAGAAIGAIGGSLAMISDAPAERIALGAAIGAVAGMGLGFITGAIRGSMEKRRFEHASIAFHLAPAGIDARGMVTGIAGKF